MKRVHQHPSSRPAACGFSTQCSASTTRTVGCLHTNAYEEAITTPTPESLRRAVAIQMIRNRSTILPIGCHLAQSTDVLVSLSHAHDSQIMEIVIARRFSLDERGLLKG